ncbi:Zn(II)2Cys6 transcription factor LALA0_S01e00298g [Lachancea lanzarotensis]|uniref:LALA0S01e00298g1_1 n=1 Tax=Lachancea lanzarotensis TaxID=1245769 RepID=A0A0C7MX13_9SACH|nr:uncharacterized protein LALA0_S01e00298g [Lachancea lanzarotensis]CEP59980.1 LALA0S01e00298g1_1 [Lachancea lanzarotensis]
MANKKMVKACTRCQQRKKKCSGDLPCEYCNKIDQPQNCEYKTKVKSKTTKVTERYVTSLKNRIWELEAELTKSRVETTPDYDEGLSTSEMNPLLEPPHGMEFRPKSSGPKTSSQYLGMSACAQFLRKLKQTLADSRNGGLPVGAVTKGLVPNNIEFSLDRKYVENLAAECLPDIEDAKVLIDNAYRMIGADYMYIEARYFENTVKHVIYDEQVPHQPLELLAFTIELLRFFSYLALGSLFDRKNQDSKSLSLKFHRTAISLYGHLANMYDQAANASLVQSLLCIAYFSLSQNKTIFAFTTVGTAIRTMFALGYHKTTRSDRESRTFWLCFIYDRLLAVRFGFPLMIDEREINVPMFNEAEEAQTTRSLDMYHFAAQARLAMITTKVITMIYSKNSFSFLRNCYTVLKRLKSWFDILPDELKFDYNNIKTGLIRSTVNLHINYNYSIIITTRPVLLYLFNAILTRRDDKEKIFEQRQFDLMRILLESCIQAAEIQSGILTRLYHDGKMANSSFLDCHYIYSATIILVLAGYCQRLMKTNVIYLGDIESLFDAINNNLKILQIISEYNAAASNFNEQLTELIDMISSEEVMGVSSPDSTQKQSSVPFPRASLSPIAMPEDGSFDGREFDMKDVGFLDLSDVLNNMTSQSLAGTSVDEFFDTDFSRSYTDAQ